MGELSKTLSKIFGAGGKTLVGEIDRYLITREQGGGIDLFGERVIRVTEVGGCQRQVWCRIMGKPFSVNTDEVDPVGIRIMESGTNAHRRLEGYLDEMGLSVYKEERTFRKGILQGTPDRLIRWNGELVVVDFKTCSSRVLSSVKTYGPPDGYIRQVNLYIYLTGAAYGLLVYESRDEKEFYEVKVKKDKAVIESCLQWVREVESAVDRNVLPKKSVDCSGVYCPFYKYCLSADGGKNEETDKNRETEKKRSRRRKK